MNEEWDRLSELFRYQNGVYHLYDIVENFIGSLGNYNDEFDQEPSESMNENDKYIQMNNMGTMEIVEEEERTPEHKLSGSVPNKFSFNSASHQSPSFLENENLQILSPNKIQNYNNSIGSKDERNSTKIDVMTFGGLSNRFVNVSSEDGTRQQKFDPLNLNSIDTGEIRATQLSGRATRNQAPVRNFHSNSFGTPYKDTAEKTNVQNFAPET
jgi:hypothetical protein